MPGAQLPPRICSRPFGEDELKIVRNIVGDGQDEGIHRSEIARRVCNALNRSLSRKMSHFLVMATLPIHVPAGSAGEAYLRGCLVVMVEPAQDWDGDDLPSDLLGGS